MTERSRRPTKGGTGVAPEAVPAAVPAAVPGVEPHLATPTEIDPSPRPIEQGTPTEIAPRPERSEPIQMISMKDQLARTERARPARDDRVPLHVQLRSLGEVRRVHDTPAGGLGHLAPPRDPRAALKRRRRSNALLACVAIALAGGISLGIWLIAGR